MKALELLPNAVMLRLDGMEISDSTIKMTLATDQTGLACPDCGQVSSRVHSRYTRTLADLPWARRRVQLHVRVRRFFCDNSRCRRRTWVEPLTGLAQRRVHRSERLAETQQQLGLALGGEAGSRLASRLTMPTSADTLLRLVRRTPADTEAAPRVLGVDDFAFRRGHHYGTLLVDLERGQRIDLLPDRERPTLADWLRQHPSVEIVTRDRAQAFIDAAAEAAPQARQVADRWHLLKNLREALERFFDRHGPELRRVKVTRALSALSPIVPEITAKVKRRPLKTIAREAEQQTGRHAQRQARFAEVQTLRAQGYSHRRIARTLKMSVNTVRRWLHRERVPEGRQANATLSKAAAYADYLAMRWRAGCRSPRQLWLELQAKGFTGSEASVWRWLLELRQAEAGPNEVLDVRPRLEVAAQTYSLNSRQAAWMLVEPPEALAPEEQSWLMQMEEVLPLVRVGRDLAQQFIGMMKAKQFSALGDWLREAEASGLRELATYATGLRRDYDAVEAALSLPWSNGPTEGHVNQLKLIKRQMFGRAKFDLLRQRVLHAI